MKKILIPTDFTLHTANALVYAIQLAKKSNAELFVLHSYHVPILNQNAPISLRVLMDRIEKIALSPFSKCVKMALSESDLDHIKLNYIFNKQVDTKNIAAIVSEKKCDVLILGTPNNPSFFNGFFGGNIENIVRRTTDCTVLVVPEAADYRPAQQMMYPTSLHTSNDALSQLNHFAVALGAKIKFLPMASEDNTTPYLERLQDFKQRIQQIFTHNNYEIVAMKPTQEDKINEVIHAHNIDLLSLFQRPKNLLSRLFLDNFASKIASKSAVPVLIMYEKQINTPILKSKKRFNRKLVSA